MATYTPQFDLLLSTEQKDIHFKRIAMREKLYPKLFDVQSITTAYVDRMRVAGLGTFALKPEGTPVAFDDPVQGTRVRAAVSTYALGFRTSMEMMEDDQWDIMRKMPADLGDSAVDHQERLAWSLLNDMFTGALFTGLEGQSLMNSAHTLLKGGTATNILSPAVGLSTTGLESIMNLAWTTTSDEGRFQKLDMDLLVVPPALQHVAYQLLETEFEVNTSNNNRSTVVRSRSGLTPLVVPYLTSTTAWSVHAGPGKNGLVWNDRKKLTAREAVDATTEDKLFFSTYRALVRTDDFRQNFGSAA